MRQPTQHAMHWLRHQSRQDSRFLTQYALSLFQTPAPCPSPAPKFDPEANTLTWLGHSTVLIRLSGYTLLTDPVLLPRFGFAVGPFILGPKRLVQTPLTIAELPRIDVVLLSHAHMDHMDFNTLAHLTSCKAICPTGTSELLERLGFQDVVELSWAERYHVGLGLHIRAVPVNHPGARFRNDTQRWANAYVLEGSGADVLFAGDTALTDAFSALQVDVALMPIGGYQPHIHRHISPEQAVSMASAAGAAHVLPIHHSTFRMSAEPAGEPMQRFLKCATLAGPQLVGWRIGERFAIPLRSRKDR